MADVLPIHAYRQEIIDQISSNRVTILSAETGAGKSTTVPLLALESALSTHADRSPRILVSQPRRIAAKQLTSRVREQVHANAAAAATARLGAFRFQRPRLNWSEVKVGYRIMNERDDEGPKTHIVYSTVGYMVRRLAGRSDELAGVTHIIVDEAHERSVDTDLLCLLIRRKMADPSLDFKVVVMSATLETDLYMDYFIEKNPPARTLLSRRAVQADERRVINVGARRFPVHRIYFESFMDHPDIRDIFRQQEKARRTREDENNVRLSTANELRSYFQLQLDKFQSAVEGKGAGATNLKPSLQSHDYVLAAKLAFNLAGLFSPDPLPDPDNVDADIGHSVLVFLPGEGEIMTWLDYAEQLIRTLQADRRSRVAVYTLFAQGPRADMEEAFVNSKPGHLKIILATNIAESSVTIPDVTAIIDHGLRRSMEYNSNVGCQMLKLGWVSRASALQREGRAGRCREGFYYAMYTKSFHDVCLAAHDEPEIRALSLEQTILRVKQLFPQELLQHVLDDLMEPPDHRQVDQAIANLQDIGGFTRSPLPKDEDLGPTDAYEVTFFGTIIPDFPGEVSHTRLMIVGLGMDIPTDAVVLAAAMSAADPFLQPTRKYQSDRAELQLQHAVAFAGRLHFDQGLHSEVLTLYNVFKEWVLTPKKERHQFLVESGLQHARFKQFRQTIALYADRLAIVVDKLTVRAGPEANEELAKVRFDKLKVLADIARERWPPQEEEILEIEDNSERELKDAVEDILAATVEELRTVVLISCSANIAQGLPGPQNAAMVPAAQALESQDLVLPNAAPKAKDTKREADRLNKLLTASLFDQSSAGPPTGNRIADANDARLHLFRDFCPKLVPDLTTPLKSQEYSYHPDQFPDASSRLRPFDARRTCVLDNRRGVAPEFLDAYTLRKSLEWLGCERVLMVGASAVVEFASFEANDLLGSVAAMSGGSASTVDEIAARLGRLRTNGSGASGNTRTIWEEGFNSEVVVGSILRFRRQRGVAGEANDEVIAMALDSGTGTTLSLADYCPAIKFLAVLPDWKGGSLYLPFPDGARALEDRNGGVAGTVRLNHEINWRTLDSMLSVRFFWRSPLATTTSIATAVQESSAESGDKVVKYGQGGGPTLFAAAGSRLLTENNWKENLAFNNVTLFPSNEVIWNLRMMVACNDMSFALTYPDKRRAVFVRHFHAFSDTEGDSLGGSYLVPEDLRAINIARARLGDALYNGIGLVEGALADALLTDLKEAADTIHSRRPSQPGSAEAVALELGMSNVRWKSVGLDVERASQPVFRSRGVPEVARAPFQEPSADDLGYGHDFSWTEEYDGADEGEQVDKEYEDEDDDDEGGTRGGRWGRRGGAAGSKWLRGNGSDEPLPPSDESFVNQMFWDLSTQYLPPLVWPR